MRDSEEKNPSDEISFEKAYRQIEEIVQILESGRGSLEDSLDQYEKAVRLVKLCRSKLESASQRIEMLKGLDPDGRVELERVEADELRSKEDVAGRQSTSRSDADDGDRTQASVKRPSRKKQPPQSFFKSDDQAPF